MGKLIKSRVLKGGAGPKGWGWGWGKEIFSIMGGGENGVKQNHAEWRRRSHPSDMPCPAPLPSLVWNNIQQLQEKQKWKEIIHVSRKLVFIVINIIIIIIIFLGSQIGIVSCVCSVSYKLIRVGIGDLSESV